MTSDIGTPRVLVSAYQCGPGMGSVSQIGWHWYRRLAQQLPTTLLTHVRNREAIEAAGGAVADSQILYVDTEWFAGPLYRFASRLFPTSEHAVFLISSLDFFVYDRAAWRLAQTSIDTHGPWDLVHAPTPVSPLATTRLYRLGVPTLLGPWNGHLGVPRGFREIMRKDSMWLSPLRDLGRFADALIGGTRHASVLLTATAATVAGIPRRYRHLCVPMLENGVDLETFQPAPWPKAPGIAGEPLRLVYVGRLVPFKGLGMLLDALARLTDEMPIQLSVVGEGPMAAEWRDQAARLGLEDRVRFLGNLPPPAVAEEMRRAHAFCLPSVRESGGAVLLEAMACARPVIAVAFGGPAEIVDDAVGRALPADGPEAVVAGFVEACRDLVRDPDTWRRRGETGRQRAEERYSWDAKVASAIALYRDLLTDPAGARARRQTVATGGGHDSGERS
ncbi:glycosyl transferase [Thiocapsa imhoffii]|uniref:Glycosyl transferase n=2 Tax=Thiocapsa imhoffii TaxID=382777 RepID=A0A9X1B7B8_9GAMM|nr:glycosyl transferase [Thiocapsa imhoffii]